MAMTDKEINNYVGMLNNSPQALQSFCERNLSFGMSYDDIDDLVEEIEGDWNEIEKLVRTVYQKTGKL